LNDANLIRFRVCTSGEIVRFRKTVVGRHTIPFHLLWKRFCGAGASKLARRDAHSSDGYLNFWAKNFSLH
jgi:hypothetical protein